MDPFKKGEPVSARKLNALRGLALRGSTPSQGFADASGVYAGNSGRIGLPILGVCAGGTAASWNNSLKQLTPGTIDIWVFNGDLEIDDSLDPVTFPFYWTDDPEEGALCGYLGTTIVIWTCGPLEGYAP